MIKTDYNIGAIENLLDRSCISERYYPLISHREQIISGLRALGCGTKSDASKLSDEALSHIGLDGVEIRLFRRFLSMYDPDLHKFKEIESLCHDQEEKAAYYELYHLPGVKAVRASLYYLSGLRSLKDVADAEENVIIEKAEKAIADNHLSCIAPLPKEVRTHIAVAKAFLWDGD